MSIKTPQNIKFYIDKFRETTRKEADLPQYFRPRAYRNAAVKFRNCAIDDYEKRYEIAVEKANLNVFKFPARELPGCDLLSDSGTTTMTLEQWSQLILGDEAYGSNEGYFELKEQIVETFGDRWRESELFIFHQGRACEHALFKTLADTISSRSKHAHCDGENNSEKLYYIIPNNGHFDTTEANVRDNNIEPRNLFCDEYFIDDPNLKFKGNINLNALEKLLINELDRIPLIYLTITNNTGGGQPVSMANIKAVSEIARKYDVPFFFDAARFAENVWFINKNEAGYEDKSIEDIFHEMFSYVDGFHISCKKDGLVNIGGMLVIMKHSCFNEKYPHFLDKLTDHQILTEAHPTYGGLAGRDLKALVQGFKTVSHHEYLDHRINQVQRFGQVLLRNGIPILTPIGGSAIYLKVDDFFDGVPDADKGFKGLALTSLMLIAGHRLCELGIYAFGSHHDGREYPPEPRVNYVRAAVPRLVYEDQDLCSTAEMLKVLLDYRDQIPSIEVIHGQNLSLRHFKSDYRFI